MSDIIQRIKNIAHEVSEGYLIFGSSMNDAIIAKADEIDNMEMLKRICEHANQNVYLAKFQDPANRNNISFELSDFDTIKKNIQESEKSMELYDTPPDDFRSSLELAVEAPSETEKTASCNHDEIFEAMQYKHQFERMANAFGMMKTAAMEEFESGFNLLYHDAKKLVAHGDSLGDMAKIAARCVKEDGLDPTSVMKAYGIIEKELVSSGFSVNTDFTKLSSMKINHSSVYLRPAKDMSIAIEKIAALEEMEENIKTIINAFGTIVYGNK